MLTMVTMLETVMVVTVKTLTIVRAVSAPHERFVSAPQWEGRGEVGGHWQAELRSELPTLLPGGSHTFNCDQKDFSLSLSPHDLQVIISSITINNCGHIKCNFLFFF